VKSVIVCFKYCFNVCHKEQRKNHAKPKPDDCCLGLTPETSCQCCLFWVVMLCGLTGGYQCFRETYCLHFWQDPGSNFDPKSSCPNIFHSLPITPTKWWSNTLN
jgi:hypothetical protein